MIKIENVDVHGWEAAIRGARNPMNSWDRSDSYYTHVEDAETLETANYEYFVGENDLKLLTNLAKAGNDHGKFLRMINVTLDITCHQVWWAEFDTYKVGTVRNSCSKMHKIHVKPFEWDDFSHEGCGQIDYALDALEIVTRACEKLRRDYNKTHDKRYWRALIELLPEGYNMRATVSLNYAVLKNMYHARKNHKLDEWHIFCEWVRSLPYAKELITNE